MNEYETRAEHVTPALKAAGWGVVEGSKIEYEFHITNGRIMGAGKPRGPKLIADYVLVYKNRKLAALDALKKSLPHQAFSGGLTGRAAGSGKVGLSLAGG